MKRFLSLLVALSLIMIVTHTFKNARVMASDQQGTENIQKSPKKTTAKDAVCGMTVQKDKALKLKHEGKNYFFCSQKCEDTFKKDPLKYAKKGKSQKVEGTKQGEKEKGTEAESETEPEGEGSSD